MLLLIAAACTTDPSEVNSLEQNNVSKKMLAGIVGTSDSSIVLSAISELAVSAESQRLLSSTVNEILRLKQEGATYVEVNAYMVNFENKVKGSNISSNEKEILLSTLSLVQYDIYATTEEDGGGRKDRDWELSVGTFKVTTPDATQIPSNAEVSEVASEIIE